MVTICVQDQRQSTAIEAMYDTVEAFEDARIRVLSHECSVEEDEPLLCRFSIEAKVVIRRVGSPIFSVQAHGTLRHINGQWIPETCLGTVDGTPFKRFFATDVKDSFRQGRQLWMMHKATA